MDDTDVEIKMIEYIRSNKGCMPEELFEAMANFLGRQKFFKLLKGLKERKIVVARPRNKREHSLELRGENPLVMVADTLDHFEFTYFELFDRVFKVLQEPRSFIRERTKQIEQKENRHVLFAPDHFDLFSYTIFVFHTTLSNYLLDISIKWPALISDKKHLSKIFELTLRRMSQLYVKLFSRIEKIKPEKDLGIKLKPERVENLSELVVNQIKDLGQNVDDPGAMGETFDFFRFRDDKYNEHTLKELLYKIPRSPPSLTRSQMYTRKNKK